MRQTTEALFSLRRYNPQNALYGNPTAPMYAGPTAELERITADSFNQLPYARVVNLADGSQMRAYEVLPPGMDDYDESRVIVRVMDFANDLAPHSYAAAFAIAACLGNRVIILPQDSVTLSQHDRRHVRYGDLTRIGEKQAEGLASIIADGQAVTALGNSFGAQAATQLAKALNEDGVRHSDKLIAIEPPNVTKRSKYQLLFDFGQAGNTHWAEAVRQSQWEPLIELLGVADADISDYMKADNRRFIKNALSLSNIAIIGAMSQPTFAEDLRVAGIYMPPESKVVIARASDSAIVPDFSLERAYDHAQPTFEHLAKTLTAVMVAPALGATATGHAAANNPFVIASLIAQA